MKRTLYGPDHEAYRETVREFLSREVAPHQDEWDRQRCRDHYCVEARSHWSSLVHWG